MPESVITILTRDHRTVDELFKKFEQTTNRAHKTRAELVTTITRELSIHAGVEETVVYPRFRKAGKEIKDKVLEGLEEHHVVKELLAELEHMEPGDERFEAKVQVLIENVRHHVKEEEGDMFPRAKKALSDSELRDLGEAVEAARSMVPTHPHPNAPDEPPGNLANVAVAGLDRAKDTAAAAIEATGHVVRETRKAVTGDR